MHAAAPSSHLARRTGFGALSVVVAALVAGIVLGGRPAGGREDGSADDATIGAEACAPCHETAYEAWRDSSHAKTFQVARPENLPPEVLAGAAVSHPPGVTQFHVTGAGDDARYFAETLGPDGVPVRYPLTHVVGRMRIQMFLTTLPDGRLQVLPGMREEPTGDWFDYTYLIFGAGGDDPMQPPLVAPGDASFWTGPVRAFDARCSRCHVSGREVGPPPSAEARPTTTWRAFGVDCEACHGPGAAHADHQSGLGGMDPMPSYRALSRERAVSICLQCHMEGEVIAQGMYPGAPVVEYLNPTLLDDPERVDPYGRPLELIYDGLPFLASTCAREGRMTCVTCHDPHGTHQPSQLHYEPTDPAMCADCHADVVAQGEAHSHHPAGRPGSSCVDCHMPFLTIERGHGAVADHTIGIPRLDPPGDRVAVDACTWCHEGGLRAPPDVPRLDASTLREGFASWWPDARAPRLWEAAVAAAREGSPGAVAGLERLLLEPSTPRFYRATAARLLGRFPEEGRDALLFFAGDEDDLVRREVVRAVAATGGEDPGARRVLFEALEDPSAGVRSHAARGALEGWTRVQSDPALLRAVLPVLAEEAEAVPDDDMRWFRLGAARYLAGDLEGAVRAYERQVALDPFAENVRRLLQQLRARLAEADEGER
ncbi:MAG: multiheme c-type cytochrome [Planctomycetota bacterium]|jgi:predicted CXXCH cytochrome family protein